MTLRPVRTALVTTALYAVVLVGTASAEPHTVRVTLVSGEVLTYTVDVSPGATATAAQLPPLPTPVQTIDDLGPVPTPTPIPTPQLPQVPLPTPTVPSVPNPTGNPLPDTGDGGGGGGGGAGGVVPADPVTGGGQTTNPKAPAKGAKDKASPNTETIKGKV